MKICDEKGFTLLELMIVLMIASLLGMGALHGWRSWQQRQQLSESVNQLQHYLLRLRNDASWHNYEHRLQVVSRSPWCIYSERTGREAALCAPWPEVTLVGATAEIGFFGRRDVARPGSITLSNASGTRRVVISARGRVRICQPDEKECDA